MTATPDRVLTGAYGAVTLLAADYSLGYVLLAVTAAVAGAVTATTVRSRVDQRSVTT